MERAELEATALAGTLRVSPKSVQRRLANELDLSEVEFAVRCCLLIGSRLVDAAVCATPKTVHSIRLSSTMLGGVQFTSYGEISSRRILMAQDGETDGQDSPFVIVRHDEPEGTPHPDLNIVWPADQGQRREDYSRTYTYFSNIADSRLQRFMSRTDVQVQEARLDERAQMAIQSRLTTKLRLNLGLSPDDEEVLLLLPVTSAGCDLLLILTNSRLSMWAMGPDMESILVGGWKDRVDSARKVEPNRVAIQFTTEGPFGSDFKYTALDQELCMTVDITAERDEANRLVDAINAFSADRLAPRPPARS